MKTLTIGQLLAEVVAKGSILLEAEKSEREKAKGGLSFLAARQGVDLTCYDVKEGTYISVRK